MTSEKSAGLLSFLSAHAESAGKSSSSVSTASTASSGRDLPERIAKAFLPCGATEGSRCSAQDAGTIKAGAAEPDALQEKVTEESQKRVRLTKKSPMSDTVKESALDGEKGSSKRMHDKENGEQSQNNGAEDGKEKKKKKEKKEKAENKDKVEGAGAQVAPDPDPEHPLLTVEGAAAACNEGKLIALVYKDLHVHFSHESKDASTHYDPQHAGLRAGEEVPDGLRTWEDKRGSGWIVNRPQTSGQGAKKLKQNAWFNIRMWGSWRLAFLAARLQRQLWLREQAQERSSSTAEVATPPAAVRFTVVTNTPVPVGSGVAAAGMEGKGRSTPEAAKRGRKRRISSEDIASSTSTDAQPAPERQSQAASTPETQASTDRSRSKQPPGLPPQHLMPRMKPPAGPAPQHLMQASGDSSSSTSPARDAANAIFEKPPDKARLQEARSRKEQGGDRPYHEQVAQNASEGKGISFQKSTSPSLDSGGNAKQTRSNGLLELEAYLETAGSSAARVKPGCMPAVVSLMGYYCSSEMQVKLLQAVHSSESSLQCLKQFVQHNGVGRMTAWMEKCFGTNNPKQLLIEGFRVLRVLGSAEMVRFHKEESIKWRLERVCKKMMLQLKMGPQVMELLGAWRPPALRPPPLSSDVFQAPAPATPRPAAATPRPAAATAGSEVTKDAAAASEPAHNVFDNPRANFVPLGLRTPASSDKRPDAGEAEPEQQMPASVGSTPASASGSIPKASSGQPGPSYVLRHAPRRPAAALEAVGVKPAAAAAATAAAWQPRTPEELKPRSARQAAPAAEAAAEARAGAAAPEGTAPQPPPAPTGASGLDETMRTAQMLLQRARKQQENLMALPVEPEPLQPVEPKPTTLRRPTAAPSMPPPPSRRAPHVSAGIKIELSEQALQPLRSTQAQTPKHPPPPKTSLLASQPSEVPVWRPSSKAVPAAKPSSVETVAIEIEEEREELQPPQLLPTSKAAAPVVQEQSNELEAPKLLPTSKAPAKGPPAKRGLLRPPPRCVVELQDGPPKAGEAAAPRRLMLIAPKKKVGPGSSPAEPAISTLLDSQLQPQAAVEQPEMREKPVMTIIPDAALDGGNVEAAEEAAEADLMQVDAAREDISYEPHLEEDGISYEPQLEQEDISYEPHLEEDDISYEPQLEEDEEEVVALMTKAPAAVTRDVEDANLLDGCTVPVAPRPQSTSEASPPRLKQPGRRLRLRPPTQTAKPAKEEPKAVAPSAAAGCVGPRLWQSQSQGGPSSHHPVEPPQSCVGARRWQLQQEGEQRPQGKATARRLLPPRQHQVKLDRETANQPSASLQDSAQNRLIKLKRNEIPVERSIKLRFNDIPMRPLQSQPAPTTAQTGGPIRERVDDADEDTEGYMQNSFATATDDLWHVGPQPDLDASGFEASTDPALASLAALDTSLPTDQFLDMMVQAVSQASHMGMGQQAPGLPSPGAAPPSAGVPHRAQQQNLMPPKMELHTKPPSPAAVLQLPQQDLQPPKKEKFKEAGPSPGTEEQVPSANLGNRCRQCNNIPAPKSTFCGFCGLKCDGSSASKQPMNIPVLDVTNAGTPASPELLAQLDRLGNLLEQQPRAAADRPTQRQSIKREAASIKDELAERSAGLWESAPLPNKSKRIKMESDAASSASSSSPKLLPIDAGVAAQPGSDGTAGSTAGSMSQEEELLFEAGDELPQQTEATPATAEEVRGIKAEIDALEERCRKARINAMDPEEVWEVDEENAVAGFIMLSEVTSDGLQDDTESEGSEEEQAGAALAALAAGM